MALFLSLKQKIYCSGKCLAVLILVLCMV
uniref:Uncharacterized protein n=1 Tax=Rhizophora mucronata TaxID=61149 RepID=A0A2P2P254_RHIMU